MSHTSRSILEINHISQGLTKSEALKTAPIGSKALELIKNNATELVLDKKLKLFTNQISKIITDLSVAIRKYFKSETKSNQNSKSQENNIKIETFDILKPEKDLPSDLEENSRGANLEDFLIVKSDNAGQATVYSEDGFSLSFNNKTQSWQIIDFAGETNELKLSNSEVLKFGNNIVELDNSLESTQAEISSSSRLIIKNGPAKVVIEPLGKNLPKVESAT